jgi:predicted alpha/beta hydrolase family esterase
MKQAFLLHGTGGSSEDYFWFGDTKAYLESCGYSVWWPQLPHTDRPEIKESLDYVIQNMPQITDEETIIIGHSSSCPLILDLLGQTASTFKQTVLVSGFYAALDDDGSSQLMLPAAFEWDKIKQASKEIIMINSDNDPWGCNDIQAQDAVAKLGARFVLAAGQGHMSSGTFNQPYREFPMLKELLAVSA